MRTSPRRVRELRSTYNAILRTRVSDQADAETQHAWWRLHDRAKREYALADWQWESLVLKTLIALVLISGAAAVFTLNALIVSVLLIALALAQCYRILTRHAPD